MSATCRARPEGATATRVGAPRSPARGSRATPSDRPARAPAGSIGAERARRTADARAPGSRRTPAPRSARTSTNATSPSSRAGAAAACVIASTGGLQPLRIAQRRAASDGRERRHRALGAEQRDGPRLDGPALARHRRDRRRRHRVRRATPPMARLTPLGCLLDTPPKGGSCHAAAPAPQRRRGDRDHARTGKTLLAASAEYQRARRCSTRGSPPPARSDAVGTCIVQHGPAGRRRGRPGYATRTTTSPWTRRLRPSCTLGQGARPARRRSPVAPVGRGVFSARGAALAAHGATRRPAS